MSNNPISTYTAARVLPQSGLLSDVNAFYGISGCDILAYDADAAGGEIYNLMSTSVGDEPFEPLLGSNLIRRVFQQINASLEVDVIQDVYFAGVEWLGHVQMDPAQTQFFANAGQRLVGIEVGYVFGGAGWTSVVPLTATGQALQSALNP